VKMLCARKCEILNKVDTSSVVFDPRPKQFQNNNPNAVETLRCDLLNVCDNGSAAFLSVLVPLTTNIKHDHTYASKAGEVEGQILPREDTSNEGSEVEENDEEPDDESDKNASRTNECVQSIYARKLVTVTSRCISGNERDNLEKLTRQQSDESLWYDARKFRITGSKCGRILNQKKRTVSLLQFALYPKPFEATPKPIEWGRRSEPLAREAYVKYMKAHGHPRMRLIFVAFLCIQ